MRVVFEFSGDLTDDELAAIQPLVEKPIERATRYMADLPMSEWPRDEDRVATHVKYAADLEPLLALLPPKCAIAIQGLADPHPLIDIEAQLDQMNAQLAALRTPKPEEYVNRRIDVHVPGNMLLRIDTVEVAEDCCTEELQRKIIKGWRILAVCPQPDQRRPDYVLGRDSTTTTDESEWIR